MEEIPHVHKIPIKKKITLVKLVVPDFVIPDANSYMKIQTKVAYLLPLHYKTFLIVFVFLFPFPFWSLQFVLRHL